MDTRTRKTFYLLAAVIQWNGIMQNPSYTTSNQSEQLQNKSRNWDSKAAYTFFHPCGVGG